MENFQERRLAGGERKRAPVSPLVWPDSEGKRKRADEESNNQTSQPTNQPTNQLDAPLFRSFSSSVLPCRCGPLSLCLVGALCSAAWTACLGLFSRPFPSVRACVRACLLTTAAAAAAAAAAALYQLTRAAAQVQFCSPNSSIPRVACAVAPLPRRPPPSAPPLP